MRIKCVAICSAELSFSQAQSDRWGLWFLVSHWVKLFYVVVSATTIHQHYVCATEMLTNYRSFISASHWIEHPSAILSVALTYPTRPRATDMLTICCLLFLVSYMEKAPSAVVSAASTDQNWDPTSEMQQCPFEHINASTHIMLRYQHLQYTMIVLAPLLSRTSRAPGREESTQYQGVCRKSAELSPIRCQLRTCDQGNPTKRRFRMPCSSHETALLVRVV
jgi:hypothetical protein